MSHACCCPWRCTCWVIERRAGTATATRIALPRPASRHSSPLYKIAARRARVCCLRKRCAERGALLALQHAAQLRQAATAGVTARRVERGTVARRSRCRLRRGALPGCGRAGRRGRHRQWHLPPPPLAVGLNASICRAYARFRVGCSSASEAGRTRCTAWPAGRCCQSRMHHGMGVCCVRGTCTEALQGLTRAEAHSRCARHPLSQQAGAAAPGARAPAAEAASAAASWESTLSLRAGSARAAAAVRSDWNAVTRTRCEHSAPPCGRTQGKGRVEIGLFITRAATGPAWRVPDGETAARLASLLPTRRPRAA